MDKIIKIVLAVLLFLCLAKMPYGYYQFVRFAGLIGFAILAYQANQQNKQTEMIVYGALALLFQPLFKIALGRELWNIVDVIVGIGLTVSIFIKTKEISNAKASTFAIRTSQPHKAKIAKELALPTHDKRNTKMTTKQTTEKEGRRHNRRLAKKRVQCLNEALCFVSSSVLAESFVLRNPLLRQAPKRQTV